MILVRDIFNLKYSVTSHGANRPASKYQRSGAAQDVTELRKFLLLVESGSREIFRIVE